jgi:transcription elongation factor SPT5
MNTAGFVPEPPRKSDNNRRAERSHPLPFLGHVKEEELSGDELEEFVRQRYSSRVRHAGHGGSAQYDDAEDEEFTHLNEPIIWRVKCMVCDC